MQIFSYWTQANKKRLKWKKTWQARWVYFTVSQVWCPLLKAPLTPTFVRMFKKGSLHSGQVAHQAGAYPGFFSMKRLLKWEYFYSPLDGMLVHRRVTPSIKFAGTHLYTWVERGTVRVKCLAQEHNTMSPARARTRSARSRVERANHEATAPPTGRL